MNRLFFMLTVLVLGTIATSKTYATECDSVMNKLESYQKAQTEFGSETMGIYSGVINYIEGAHREYSKYEGGRYYIPLNAFNSLRKNAQTMKDWRDEEKVEIASLNEQLKDLIGLVESCIK